MENSVSSTKLELALEDVFDYYRLPLVNSVLEDEQLQIKIPLVFKNKKRELHLAKITSRPFMCPTSECIENSALQIKLRDDLLIFEHDSLVGSSKSGDWQCSLGSDNRICSHSSSSLFDSTDNCIAALFEKNVKLNSCSVSRFKSPFDIKPMAISASENYHTKLIDGKLRGQVVGIGSNFDPKLPSWTIDDFVVGFKPNESMFAQFVVKPETNGLEDVGSRLSNLEYQAQLVGIKIQGEVNELKQLAKQYPPPMKRTFQKNE